MKKIFLWLLIAIFFLGSHFVSAQEPSQEEITAKLELYTKEIQELRNGKEYQQKINRTLVFFMKKQLEQLIKNTEKYEKKYAGQPLEIFVQYIKYKAEDILSKKALNGKQIYYSKYIDNQFEIVCGDYTLVREKKGEKLDFRYDIYYKGNKQNFDPNPAYLVMYGPFICESWKLTFYHSVSGHHNVKIMRDSISDGDTKVMEENCDFTWDKCDDSSDKCWIEEQTYRTEEKIIKTAVNKKVPECEEMEKIYDEDDEIYFGKNEE